MPPPAEPLLATRLLDVSRIEAELKAKEHHLERHLATACGVECKHKRPRSLCEQCVGGVRAGICEHEVRLDDCKECNPGIVCKHEVRRKNCKECNPGMVCKHAKRRSDCKECNPGKFCKHAKRSSDCKECSPGKFCACGQKPSKCKKAGCKKPKKPIKQLAATGKRKRATPE